MRTRAGLAGLVVLVVSFLSVAASPAAAEPAAAVVGGNSLWLFDTASPGAVTTRPITGLGVNESVRGIDVRPASGQVYIGTVTSGSAANSVIKTYTLDTSTGVATVVGQTAAALAGAADVPTGWDFIANALSATSVGDRIRYVNTNDENARINPTGGALAANDTDLTPAATTTIIATAYSRNTPGAGVPTQYVIDRNDSQLGIQGGIDATPSPNGGVVTDLAPLGFNLNQANDGGFDISPSGIAYAALTDAGDNLTRLYRLNLPTALTATPAATPVGLIMGGATEIRGFTILDDDRDADGVLSSADNCDAAANPDQADLEGDGVGDTCDDDDDGDGLPDGVEAQIGTDPRSADTDGDGKSDLADRCPTIASTAANGCPELAPPLSFTLSRVPKAIRLRTLRNRGISVTVEPNIPASFLLELRGRARGAGLARAGDIVLAERRLSLAGGRRTARLKVARGERRRLRRGKRLVLRVTATDAQSRTKIATRRLRIR